MCPTKWKIKNIEFQAVKGSSHCGKHIRHWEAYSSFWRQWNWCENYMHFLQLSEKGSHPCIQRDMLDIVDWGKGQHPHTSLEEIPHSAILNYTRAVVQLRQYYVKIFITADIVPWQWKMIYLLWWFGHWLFISWRFLILNYQ